MGRVIFSSSGKRRSPSRPWRWPSTDPQHAGSGHDGPLALMTPVGRVLLSIFLAFLLTPTTARAQPQPESGQRPIVVKDVVVHGNRRIQEAVVLGRVGT